MWLEGGRKEGVTSPAEGEAGTALTPVVEGDITLCCVSAELRNDLDNIFISCLRKHTKTCQMKAVIKGSVLHGFKFLNLHRRTLHWLLKRTPTSFCCGCFALQAKRVLLLL